jgi:hypothetical protein
MPDMRGSDLVVIPDEFQDILNAGIGLFQLAYPRKLYRDEKIWGLFGARAVTTNPDEFNLENRRYRIEWQTSKDCYVRFFENKGRGYAYVPDDQFWHNRLIFLHQPRYLGWLHQLKLPDGSVLMPPDVRMEIGCLADEILEEKKTWEVHVDGIQRDWFFSKKEADEFIKDEKSVTPKIVGGKIMPIKKDRRKFTTVESKKSEIKPEIKELIKREKYKHRFGWSECDEFMKEIKPKVVANIQEKRKTMTIAPAPAISKADLIETLMSLTPEDRASLLGGKKKEKVE